MRLSVVIISGTRPAFDSQVVAVIVGFASRGRHPIIIVVRAGAERVHQVLRTSIPRAASVGVVTGGAAAST